MLQVYHQDTVSYIYIVEYQRAIKMNNLDIYVTSETKLGKKLAKIYNKFYLFIYYK